MPFNIPGIIPFPIPVEYENGIEKKNKNPRPVDIMKYINDPRVETGMSSLIAVYEYPVGMGRIVKPEVINNQNNERGNPLKAISGSAGKIKYKECNCQEV